MCFPLTIARGKGPQKRHTLTTLSQPLISITEGNLFILIIFKKADAETADISGKLKVICMTHELKTIHFIIKVVMTLVQDEVYCLTTFSRPLLLRFIFLFFIILLTNRQTLKCIDWIGLRANSVKMLWNKKGFLKFWVGALQNADLLICLELYKLHHVP